MTDNLNPTGPSQPTLNQAYTTPGNPATQDSQEQRTSEINKNSNSSAVDQRVPQSQSSSIEDATPSSLGQGIHGAPAGEESKGLSQADVDRSNELDAVQMGAPGEGKVEDAVSRKPGAGPGEPGLETDLDRKKAEQAPLRGKMEERAQDKVDVGGVLGQRSAPADPTD